MRRLLSFSMAVLVLVAGTISNGMSVQAASIGKADEQVSKQVTKYLFRDESVRVDYFALEDCVSTSVSAVATESATKVGPGQPLWYSNVTMVIARGDGCTGEWFFIGTSDADLPAQAFSVQGDLNSALLDAQVPVLVACCGDLTGSTVMADMNLNWSGTGPITKGKESSKTQVEGCKVSYTVEGNNRPASASGNMTVADIQFVIQPNSTAASNTAKISSSKVGQIEIGCE